MSNEIEFFVIFQHKDDIYKTCYFCEKCYLKGIGNVFSILRKDK